MNKIIVRYFTLLLFFGLFYNTIYAQVTIGSNEAPPPGALLQLKDDKTYTNHETSTKGMGMPRIELTDKMNLYPMFIDDKAGGYKIGSTTYTKATQDTAHIGMIVYNINECFDNGEGLYVWDGAKWQSLARQPQRPTLEYAMTSKTGLEQPNSYIVSESAVLKIPIEKAFAVWDGSSWQGDITTRSSTMKPVLSTAKDLANMTLEAKIVWKDDCSNKLIINASDLKIIGTGSSAYIEVWVGDKKGNAVVALVKQGDNPETDALWSWHIWATEDPTNKITNNGKQWLDRNLGATVATPADVNTIGLYYQWGRKDPMPTSAGWTNNHSVVYGASGNLINYTAAGYMATAKSNDPTANLTTSISRPLSFINTSSGSSDWYNPTSGSSWHDRWDASSTKKSVSDPCPEGWRVPNGRGVTTYPWNQGSAPWSTLTIANAGKFNKGYNWSTDTVPAGYYPAVGRYHYGNALMALVGTNGYYWSAAPYNGSARILSFTSTSVKSWDYDYRGYGLPVRCIQE